MKINTITLKSSLLLATITFLLSFLSAQSQESTSISLRYAFIYQQQEQPINVIDTKKISTALNSGDKLKIFLQPLENAYIYLFYLDSEGKLYLLFPEQISFFETDYKFNKKYFLPIHGDWYVLDENIGVEEFFLLVSPERLAKLEAKTLEYYIVLNSMPVSRQAVLVAQQNVLDEIRRLRKEHSSFAGLEERPVPVAGEYRGIEGELEFLATEIKTQEFYTKTIRIS